MRMALLMRESFAFLLVIVSALFPIRSMAADSWQGKVADVVDGATLDITKPDGGTERVKLYAVRVPVTGNPKGDAARQQTVSWCHQWGDVAEVQPMEQGPDGQVVARVIVGHEDLAGVLTKACLASIDIKTCRERRTMGCAFWHAWELQCRDEKKGLWAAKKQ